MSDIDVTNVVVFDVIRALNRVALNPNRNIVFTRQQKHLNVLFVLYEPLREKIGLRGFRPDPTQTGLCSRRRWLEAEKF